jgi:hypothetical protein
MHFPCTIMQLIIFASWGREICFWFYYESSCNVSVPLKFAFFKTNENNKVTIQFLLMNRATQESYL